jgi:aryl-alcohol dehydrogenase-like predicted oxidoreductase
MSRLALGTAQFGLAYGIQNVGGRVPPDEVAVILARAWGAGVQALDTAIAYGVSESTLGEIGVEGWQVTTKLPAFTDEVADIGTWVRNNVEESLARLRLTRLYGLLLHRPAQLEGERGPELYGALGLMKEEGAVEKIGVSVYSPRELNAIVPRYRLDLVQAPLNLVDRRLVTSGWLARLRETGVETHVRSIFLQGLLLMDANERPSEFRRWASLFQRLEAWLAAEGVTAVEACVRFAFGQPQVDRVVVGVDRVSQLDEILSAAALPPLDAPAELSTTDRDLIEPARWVRA